MPTLGSELPNYGRVSEPELIFHPNRSSDRHVHPLRGLMQFGPFSRSLLNTVLDPLRIAVICANDQLNDVKRLIGELERQHEPTEQKDYTPIYTSFSAVFGVRATMADAPAIHLLPPQLDSELAITNSPHLALGNAVDNAIRSLEAHRSEFDVVLILLPDRWSIAFEGPPGDDFDLHHFIKAITAVRGMPTQIVNEGGGLQYPCRASVMWSLSIALYTKAGGVPWMLADTDPDRAFIGLGHALKPDIAGGGRFVCCCSQVFDSDGSGLEFIGYQAHEAYIDQDNPYLSRPDMFNLITRSLDLYGKRHAGRLPSRLVIHKSTEFKFEEIDGCFDAWKRSEGLELIQVQQQVGWRGLKIDAPPSGRGKGVPARFPVDRGTFQPIGDFETLLWTQGDVAGIVSNRHYYKEAREIPHPILLRRFAGHGGWEDNCSQVLGLTKMNWNNHNLYDRMPVTLGYAYNLAQVIRRVPKISTRAYQFRFFM